MPNYQKLKTMVKRYIRSSFILPFPVFLWQICHHDLQVLEAFSVNSSHVQFLPALIFFFLCPDKK